MKLLVVQLDTDISFADIVEAFKDFDPQGFTERLVVEVSKPTSLVLVGMKPMFDIEALKRAVDVQVVKEAIEEETDNKPWSKKSKYRNNFKKSYR